jgi:hypothetical protein
MKLDKILFGTAAITGTLFLILLSLLIIKAIFMLLHGEPIE